MPSCIPYFKVCVHQSSSRNWEKWEKNLEARRVFAVGLEFGVKIPRLELLGEPLILAPESPDVVDGKFDHGQTLQAKAKSPGFPVLPAIGVQNLLLYHSVWM